MNARKRPESKLTATGGALFVYGTLRPEADSWMASFLADRSKHIGLGSTKGRIYNMGEYPAFVGGDESGEVVGDVVRLKYDATWARLDAYEGVPDFYTRRIVPVRLESGRTIYCWVYEITELPESATLIESGDWLVERIAKLPASVD